MRILLTGANGFIGQNLRFALAEQGNCEILEVTRATSGAELRRKIGEAEAVIHLAGVNRPPDPTEFAKGNAAFTLELCRLLADGGKAPPLAVASSIQATLDNPYGRSKRAAEEYSRSYALETGAGVAVYRLPNVFGKWCRPDYNSAVATFCHRLAHGEAIQVNDPAAKLRLVYIDDVVAQLLRFLAQPPTHFSFVEVSPEYSTTVGELADQIRAFADVRESLLTERVGQGLTRALYATYLSYLSPAEFSYAIPRHEDPRGVFVEMLKTQDSGQFSFFTAHPGITRGGHYHHTKSEKFLVLRGRARFNFRNVLTNEQHSLETSGQNAVVVETVPGWSHDITNVGDDELIVMLWANEVFDRDHPDTIACKV